MTEKHTCQDCGEKFEHLTQYRLHDCPSKRKKKADRVHLQDFGFTEGDGWPFVAFRVELEVGSDTKGKFDLAFAALEPPDEDPCFAFIDGDNQPIEKVEWNDDIREWLKTVHEKNGYTTCINYENTEYMDEYGNYGFIVTGRNLGLVYDWVERDEPLPRNYQYIIPQIIQELDMRKR